MARRKDVILTLLFSSIIILSSIVIVIKGSFYNVESHIVLNKFIKSESSASSYVFPLSMVSRDKVGKYITLGRYSVFLRFTTPNKDAVHIYLDLGVGVEYYFMTANDSIMKSLCSITGSSLPDTPLNLTVSIVLNVNNRSTLELPDFEDELIPWCQHETYASIGGLPGSGVFGVLKETEEVIDEGLVNGYNVINVTYVVRARWLTSIDDVAKALNVSSDVLRRDVSLTAVVIPSATMSECIRYRLVPATYVFLLAVLSVTVLAVNCYVLLKRRRKV